jgi:hypothetical protein
MCFGPLGHKRVLSSSAAAVLDALHTHVSRPYHDAGQV